MSTLLTDEEILALSNELCQNNDLIHHYKKMVELGQGDSSSVVSNLQRLYNCNNKAYRKHVDSLYSDPTIVKKFSDYLDNIDKQWREKKGQQ